MLILFLICIEYDLFALPARARTQTFAYIHSYSQKKRADIHISLSFMLQTAMCAQLFVRLFFFN